MNLRKFQAATTREALRQVRAELGPNAIILANRPAPGGVEITAVSEAEAGPLLTPLPSVPAPAILTPERFGAPPAPAPAVGPDLAGVTKPGPPPVPNERRRAGDGWVLRASPARTEPVADPAVDPGAGQGQGAGQDPGRPAVQPMGGPAPDPAGPPANGAAETAGAMAKVAAEIQALRDVVEGQLAGFAWGERRHHAPAQVEVLRALLTAGFSPALARQIAGRVPETPGEGLRWLKTTLVRNCRAVLGDDSVIARGGVYALVGPTGAGKTTTVAKLAARAVVEYGAATVGLITADNYRIGAHEQLRIYGRILNVPVQGVKDAAELEGALADFADRRLVIIDTMGLSQRDSRVHEQTEFLCGGGRRVERLLLLNAAAQGATLDDVTRAYGGPGLAGCILSKLDEAQMLGGALDVIARRGLKLHFVANGQRVPEDLHAPNPAYLVDRALKGVGSATFAYEETEFPLLLGDPLAVAPMGPRGSGVIASEGAGGSGATAPAGPRGSEATSPESHGELGTPETRDGGRA